MRLIGSARAEDDLSKTCKLDVTWPVAVVGQSDAADFRVGVRNHRDFVTSLDAAIPAADGRPVWAQFRVVFVIVRSEGLAARGPDPAVIQIANVAILTPAVAGAVVPPTSEVHPFHNAVTTA
jgi:hypothetical protein